MNLRENLVVAKGRIITPEIFSCQYNQQTYKYDIKFKTGKVYSYSYSSVKWLKNPTVLNPAHFKIVHKEKQLFNISAIFLFKDGLEKYWHVCFENGSERDYFENNLKIEVSCLYNGVSQNIFQYLTETANFVSLKAEDGTKLLLKQYEKITFVEKDNALASYLNPDLYPIRTQGAATPIFPFGCNASQFMAVKNALENQISIVQGPPGTGKTQTILNIIANLLINGKTVQVVSNNNSATANILNKLSSPEYGMGFLVALLGNSENKAHFISKQNKDYPEIIKTWYSDLPNRNDFFEDLRKRSLHLNTIFISQEKIAVYKQETNALEVEYRYFRKYLEETEQPWQKIKTKKPVKSESIFRLWKDCQNFMEKNKGPSFLFKLKWRFKYGISEWKSFPGNTRQILNILQLLFYRTRIEELNKEINKLDEKLTQWSQKKLLDEFSELSMRYLKTVLYKRYGKKSERKVFSEEDLWKNPENVLEEYPVVLSTTFSSRSSLGREVKFDYLIMDEASQVDIATGSLALSSAKNVVIVGDTKQLPNVITGTDRVRLEEIFKSYHISRNYCFTENSFLQSVCTVLPQAPNTLLREHYRCHPKIINFCNKKFYDGNLVIMSKDEGNANVISVIKTVIGNHERDRMNQRQVDVINKEILPTLPFSGDEIGIIAPYNNQVRVIKDSLSDKNIDVATVHKFQGREKDAIIITTVDDEVTDFSDDPYLLNVAISRAKKYLCLVVSGNTQPKDSNIGELIDYIEYNNFSIDESKIRSVFDLLYKQYTEARFKFLKKYKKVSNYDSENLMYILIKNTLYENSFSALDIICHHPLNMLIRDLSLLNDEERRYAMNNATHLDFLIYNRITKKPVLAIEVDGFHFHKKGTVQSERDIKKNHILELYGIPLIRFSTNQSDEKGRLIEKLKEIHS